MHWELTTPWGTWAIGYFDGFLLYVMLISFAAVLGPFTTIRNTIRGVKKEESE